MKLLRVLQEREVERLGSNKTLHIDVRVIAATNRDLRAALEDGTFREDLYYRLNVVPIEIPPLRERKEDIPYLVRLFVDKLAQENGGHVRSITDAAIDKLMQYSWPGNVREIEECDRTQYRDDHRRQTRCGRYPAGYESSASRAAGRNGAAGRNEPRRV